jgi:NitT/TauT family transport system substrate-binding protein
MSRAKPAEEDGMSTMRKSRADRRAFLASISALGAGALLGYDLKPAAAEPPPEVSKIRLVQNPAICLAPQYLAEELLRLEGFAEIEYPAMRDSDADSYLLVLDGRSDMTMEAVTALVPALDSRRSAI